MFIYVINLIKKIVNEYKENDSIILFLIKVYSLFIVKNEDKKCIKEKESVEEEEIKDFVKIIHYCNYCQNIIGSEMYCYQDKYYCTEICRDYVME